MEKNAFARSRPHIFYLRLWWYPPSDTLYLAEQLQFGLLSGYKRHPLSSSPSIMVTASLSSSPGYQIHIMGKCSCIMSPSSNFMFHTSHHTHLPSSIFVIRGHLFFPGLRYIGASYWSSFERSCVLSPMTIVLIIIRFRSQFTQLGDVISIMASRKSVVYPDQGHLFPCQVHICAWSSGKSTSVYLEKQTRSFKGTRDSRCSNALTWCVCPKSHVPILLSQDTDLSIENMPRSKIQSSLEFDYS